MHSRVQMRAPSGNCTVSAFHASTLDTISREACLCDWQGSMIAFIESIRDWNRMGKLIACVFSLEMKVSPVWERPPQHTKYNIFKRCLINRYLLEKISFIINLAQQNFRMFSGNSGAVGHCGFITKNRGGWEPSITGIAHDAHVHLHRRTEFIEASRKHT